MVDYVEDPIGRIVNVHWDDKKPPPDDGWPPILRCGTYNYAFDLNPSADGRDFITNNPIGPDGNPFMVRDPASTAYKQTVNFLSVAYYGITFGFPWTQTTTVFMTPQKFRIQAHWDIGTSMQGLEYGLIMTHLGGPRDYNRWPNNLGLPPAPLTPFFVFGANGTLDWTYQMIPGSNGQIWHPKYVGTPPNLTVDYNDPTRFDPAYGGDTWLQVLERVIGESHWSVRVKDGFWVGAHLGPNVAPGPPQVNTYGQQIHFSITSICPDVEGHENEIPLVLHDDGEVHPLGSP